MGSRGQTVILATPKQRALACDLIQQAPQGAIVNVKAPTRTLDQNAKLWAMISDVSRAEPQGRKHPPEVWKCLFMHACGWEVQFQMGLNGEPFPMGYRSSRLTKAQCAELIEFIYAFGAENGIEWSEPEPEWAA